MLQLINKTPFAAGLYPARLKNHKSQFTCVVKQTITNHKKTKRLPIKPINKTHPKNKKVLLRFSEITPNKKLTFNLYSKKFKPYASQTKINKKLNLPAPTATLITLYKNKEIPLKLSQINYIQKPNMTQLIWHGTIPWGFNTEKNGLIIIENNNEKI